MRWTKLMQIALALLSISGTAAVLTGCGGIPKGTAAQMQVGAAQVTATGAGIVKADAQKTTFQIECDVCGFESEVITIDTPAAGAPYTLDWTCPKCGHKQKITITVSAATKPPAQPKP